jgi:hypothetical protein
MKKIFWIAQEGFITDGRVRKANTAIFSKEPIVQIRYFLHIPDHEVFFKSRKNDFRDDLYGIGSLVEEVIYTYIRKFFQDKLDVGDVFECAFVITKDNKLNIEILDMWTYVHKVEDRKKKGQSDE